MIFTAGSADAQQPYPSKPIRLIVPFPAGGGVDTVARIIAPKLSKSFGVTVVVDNRPGAGGSVGTEAAVTANPDGYTALLVGPSYAANAALYKLPYDAVNDVAAIALLGEFGIVVTLNPSLPVNTIKELIAYDKANPRELNYGSGGTGSGGHLATELFNQMAGTRMTHVPYKGVGPAVSELLGGQIHVIIGPFSVMNPHVRSNRLRAIAVTAAKRLNVLPDVPTVAESVPGYEEVGWYGVLGPKALPKEIVARWSSELNRILQIAEVKERMASDGFEPAGVSSERFREVLKQKVVKMQRVVKLAGIKPES
jgi:tripartite-type tricarboxylate transporter receptor subunit TctC